LGHPQLHLEVGVAGGRSDLLFQPGNVDGCDFRKSRGASREARCCDEREDTSSGVRGGVKHDELLEEQPDIHRTAPVKRARGIFSRPHRYHFTL
jgi:hypothetical protein